MGQLPPIDCDACPRIDPDRADRIIRAVLENISNWEARLKEIADAAHPTTGNKARALALQRDLMLARLSLCRLAGLEGDPVCDAAADAREATGAE